MQLHAYSAADEPERRHCQAIIDLLTGGDGAFSRHHFEPGHVTASSFIVDPAAGRLLLHHHRRLNRWLQMGGHLEGDETTIDAALREGAEESGLGDLALLREDIVDLDVHLIPAGKGEPEHRHFDVRYVAFTRQPQSIIIDPNESSDLCWVMLDAAGPLMNEEASWRAIGKIRSLL